MCIFRGAALREKFAGLFVGFLSGRGAARFVIPVCSVGITRSTPAAKKRRVSRRKTEYRFSFPTLRFQFSLCFRFF